jgi:hypothetical protein
MPDQIKGRQSAAIKHFELLHLIIERTISTPKKLAERFKGLQPPLWKLCEKRDTPKALGPPKK